MTRIFLIGEHNPYGADPRYALFPAPARSAGARLCRVLGMTRAGYIARFERRNLLTGPSPERDVFRWSVSKAREAASAIRRGMGEGDCAVLLGARVAAAFGAPFKPCEGWTCCYTGSAGPGEVLYLTIPHPSGRSLLWNEQGMADRVRLAVEELWRSES